MSDKKIEDALEYGIASNAIEGLYTSKETREVIKKALESGRSDKSFLYELMKKLETNNNDLVEGEKNVKIRK